MLRGRPENVTDEIVTKINNSVPEKSSTFLGDERWKLGNVWNLTIMQQVANFANTKWCKKNWKMTETLAHGYL